MFALNYVRSALKKPTLPTQMSISACLAGTSDFVCQKFVEKHKKVDLLRTGRFALLISCLVVPITSKFFHFLEKFIAPAAASAGYKEKAKVGLKRVAFDQLVAAPTFTGIVLFSLNFFETVSPGDAFARTRAIYFDVVKTNWKVWPFVQFVNLAFVPIHFRICVIQFVAFFWNIFISYMQHESKQRIHHSH